MKLGIFAKTWAGTEPGALFAAARKAGYSAVQYNMTCSGLQDMPEEIPAAAAAAVRAASVAHGVEMSAVSATYNMAHPDPAVRQAGLVPDASDRIGRACHGNSPAHPLHRNF